MRTWYRGLLAITLLAGCGRGNQGAVRLSGEWRVRMSPATVPRASAARPPVEGRMVFDERIAQYGYGGGGIPLPDRAVTGRAFVSADTGAVVSRDSDRVPFHNRPDADLIEEVIAVPTNDGHILFELGPRLSDYGLELRASRSKGAMRGTWVRLVGRDTLGQGIFEMWSVRRSAATDSAIVRSRRGVQLWESEGKSKRTPADTVLRPVSVHRQRGRE